MTTIRIPERSISVPSSVSVGSSFTVAVGVINKEINEPILQGSNCGSFLGGDGEKTDVTMSISHQGTTLAERTETVCALYGLETLDLAQTVEFDNIVINQDGDFSITFSAETQRKLGEGNFASAGPFNITAIPTGEAPDPPENGNGGNGGDEGFNFVRWVGNNPGKAAVGGIAGAIVLNGVASNIGD